MIKKKNNENLYSQFKDKIIVVTGSTQGSGAETARLLAKRGAKGITICGRNEKKGKQVKKEIEKIGTECIYVKADLENLKDCKKIISRTDKKFGTINSLINSAAFTDGSFVYIPKGVRCPMELSTYFRINAAETKIEVDESRQIE